jgi:hypothetical protein
MRAIALPVEKGMRMVSHEIVELVPKRAGMPEGRRGNIQLVK